jgi:predicted nucleic acid-binding protein
VGAVSVYLDVNVLVALLVVDTHNDRADKAVNGLHDDLVVSNLSAAEFSSAIARRVSMRDLHASEARTAFANFDIWCARHTSPVEVENIDISAATSLMRRLDFPLRTPDALHIAITQRTGCALLTFDRTMASIARAIGVNVIKT